MQRKSMTAVDVLLWGRKNREANSPDGMAIGSETGPNNKEKGKEGKRIRKDVQTNFPSPLPWR